ncbi:hypothetical protein [Streptomyces thioluteus]
MGDVFASAPAPGAPNGVLARSPRSRARRPRARRSVPSRPRFRALLG